MSNNFKLIGGVILVLIFIYSLLLFDIPYKNNPDDFATCVAMGNPVMESFPRQCRGKNGTLFVEDVKQASSTNLIINSL